MPILGMKKCWPSNSEEWVLARDEVLVSDGHEQNICTWWSMVRLAFTRVMPVVKTSKLPPGEGAAFGEMAFLSGGVASASVRAIGGVFWRMDHELIEFIGQNGFLWWSALFECGRNSFWSVGRRNHKVLQWAGITGVPSAPAVRFRCRSAKSAALKQMQGKVASMQNAFEGSAVKKSG